MAPLGVDGAAELDGPAPNVDSAWSCWFCAAELGSGASADLVVAGDLVAALGDGDGNPSPDGPGPEDLLLGPVRDVTMQLPDLPPVQGTSVSCGNVDCMDPKVACCRKLPYGPGTCVSGGDPCPALLWRCDDTTDCNGVTCCSIPNLGSECTSPKDCLTMKGQALCRKPSDCSPGESCCATGPSPPYFCAKVCP